MPAAGKSRAKTPEKGRRKKGAARKRAAPAVSLAGALAEAAWAEADAALAEALADLDEAQTASDEAARDDAMAMLAQSLSRAARKRGLSRQGELGARAPYDPARQVLDDAGGRAPKTVRIAARGVSRGAEVLCPIRVRRLRKRRP